MDTLDKYLVKELLIYFILVLFGLAVLFLAVDFFSKFWSLSMPVNKVLTIYLYKTPEALRQFVPVACLMSTLLVVSAMSKQNEVLALYASGIGTLRMAYTFISVVAALSAISFMIFDPLVPTFEKKRQILEKGLEMSETNLLNFNRGRFWYRSGKIIYNVGNFNSQKNILEDVNLFILTPEGGISKKIRAERAKFIDNDWTLENGFVIDYPETLFPKTSFFQSQRGIIPEKPGDYKTLEIQPETMRLKELRKFISRNRSYGLDTTRQQVSYHERISMVFTPLIFVLLGVAFALKPLKTQSVAKGVAFCFLVVFVYLILFRLTVSVGKGGFLPPFVAGWTPNFIFLGIASMMIFKRK
jgi:lipopolysaccharide export system permease protein